MRAMILSALSAQGEWLQHAPRLFLGGVALLSAALLWHFARFRRTVSQLIARTPTTPIRRLRPRVSEIVGKLESPERPLVSPVSRVPCAWRRVSIREWTTGTSTSPSGELETTTGWFEVASDERGLPLVVNDGTGRAELDVTGAEVHVRHSVQVESGALTHPLTEELSALLQRAFREPPEVALSTRRLRFDETLLPAEATVFVLGVPRARSGGWRFGAGRPHPFVVSDLGEPELLRRTSRHATGLYLGAAVALGAAVWCASVLF